MDTAANQTTHLILKVVNVFVAEAEAHAMEAPPELVPRKRVPAVLGARARVLTALASLTLLVIGSVLLLLMEEPLEVG